MPSLLQTPEAARNCSGSGTGLARQNALILVEVPVGVRICMIVARLNPTNRGGKSVPLGNFAVYHSGKKGVTRLAAIAPVLRCTSFGLPPPVDRRQTRPPVAYTGR